MTEISKTYWLFFLLLPPPSFLLQKKNRFCLSACHITFNMRDSHQMFLIITTYQKCQFSLFNMSGSNFPSQCKIAPCEFEFSNLFLIICTLSSQSFCQKTPVVDLLIANFCEILPLCFGSSQNNSKCVSIRNITSV